MCEVNSVPRKHVDLVIVYITKKSASIDVCHSASSSHEMISCASLYNSPASSVWLARQYWSSRSSGERLLTVWSAGRRMRASTCGRLTRWNSKQPSVCLRRAPSSISVSHSRGYSTVRRTMAPSSFSPAGWTGAFRSRSRLSFRSGLPGSLRTVSPRRAFSTPPASGLSPLPR
jgi:hypothetical protein